MKKRASRHLPLIDSFEFMQWCDHSIVDAVKCREAFILVHQDGLTPKEAGINLCITDNAVTCRIRKYVKLANQYLEQKK